MHELLERPDVLLGSTYKIRSPLVEHALYVTINDIVLNRGTADESRRPFEVFINSKNMDHFQWIVALTRILSAVFRKGGDVGFLVEEMQAVFDPRGGYFKPGGVTEDPTIRRVMRKGMGDSLAGNYPRRPAPTCRLSGASTTCVRCR